MGLDKGVYNRTSMVKNMKKLGDIQLRMFELFEYSQNPRAVYSRQRNYGNGDLTHYISVNKYNDDKYAKGDEGYGKGIAWERDGGTCQICGEKADEVHHINPKYLGGSNHPDNLICLCSTCHFYIPDDYSKFDEYASTAKTGKGFAFLYSLEQYGLLDKFLLKVQECEC